MGDEPVPESGEQVARIAEGELTEFADRESGRILHCRIPEDEWEEAVDDSIEEVVLEPVSE